MERSIIQIAQFLSTVSKALSTKKLGRKQKTNKQTIIDLVPALYNCLGDDLKIKKKNIWYTWYGGIKSKRNIKWKVFVETTNSNLCFGLTFVIQLSENNLFTKHIYYSYNYIP